MGSEFHTALLKHVFCKCVAFYNEFIDHGRRRGDATQALAPWRHPSASSEAWDFLHREMSPASYHRIRMATKIASNLYVFSLVIVNSAFVNNLR